MPLKVNLPRTGALSALLYLSACSLLNPLDGYSGGTKEPDDAGTLVPTEASGDGSALADASNDAGLEDSGPDRMTPVFFDDFNRPDGRLGNGWKEKADGIFIVSNGRALTQPADNYRSSITYRPFAEDVSDVEVSVDVTIDRFSGVIPQVHARARRATVNNPDTLDSYLLFVDCTPTPSPRAYLARTREQGGVESTQQQIILSAPIEEGVPFRLRLRVSGENPVKVQGFIESVSGASPKLIGQLTWLDTSPSRIAEPGATGLSNFAANMAAATTYSYDNFRVTSL